MAEVAEVVNEIEHVKKDAEKKVVDVEEDKIEAKKEKDSKPKENGKSETNEKSEPETNGNTESGEDAATGATGAAAKRKSGAGDVVDGTPTEGATPEKKAKISADEKDSTNGESEVAASDGAGDAKNSSYQKHF